MSKFYLIFFARFPWPWLSPPLAAFQYVMLCTSSFVDDVMFSHIGPMANAMEVGLSDSPRGQHGFDQSILTHWGQHWTMGRVWYL